MPVKRTKKQSKKRGGGIFDNFSFFGKKEESQPAPAPESAPAPAPAPESAPAPAPAPAGVEPLAVPEVKEAPAGEQAQAVGAESGEPPKPKTEEVRKPEGVEEPVVAKTNSSWWPFSGGKSRRKRSAKCAKGSVKGSKGSAKKRSAKGAKSSAKGSAKRCSKKNCKSRKHKP